jgi:hypothetical protein
MRRTSSLLLISICILYAITAAAAAPELNVAPTTVEWTDNRSVPVNIDQTLQYNITNENDTKRIYNVSLPRRPWLQWSANQFDLNTSETRVVNATITPQQAGTITGQFNVAYKYNQTGLNESEYGQSWQMTFDKNSYPTLQFMIDAYYRHTSIALASLDYAFTLDLGEEGSSVFKITNTGNETAYDIHLTGENLSFDKSDGFNVSAESQTLVPFSATIPRPRTNPSRATNTTYRPTITVSGRNLNQTMLPVNVTVPYKNYTEVEEDDQDISSLLDKFEEFCETNNCSAVQETVYRNRTVYVNQTPIYDANLTPEMRATLANLTALQTENWQAVRDRQRLMKQAINAQFANVTTEINRMQREHERETRRLRSTIQSLNRTIAAERETETRQQRQSSTVALVIFGLVLLLLLAVGTYYVVNELVEDDWRLIN